MEESLYRTIQIEKEIDLVKVRKTVREEAERMGFRITDVTRIITAASELSRNILLYAIKGKMNWRLINDKNGKAIELIFEDNGPGISNIKQAMEPGFSTSGGLGLGLPGTKRLVDEMNIESEPNQGTSITIKKYLRRKKDCMKIKRY